MSKTVNLCIMIPEVLARKLKDSGWIQPKNVDGPFFADETWMMSITKKGMGKIEDI
jgi:hypothetical protein